MKRRADLRKVALRIARAIGPEDCLLAGAMAVAAHGYPRATRDVDLVTRIPLAEARRRLRAAGIAATLRRGDAPAGDFPCVTGVLDGISFDVLPELVPLDWDGALEVPIAGSRTLRLVDLSGLLALKLRAAGAQDLMDVAMLLHEHPEHRERARELAVAYRVAGKLESWLNDRRLTARGGGHVRSRRGRARR